jgi:catechol 2,3-dioxygenase-like lactoylglutathione lyase family enzyme
MPPSGDHAAAAFYGGGLGMERVPKPKELAVRGGCWFRGDGIEIHLGVEEGFRPSERAHPALLVAGLAALRERLDAGGFETVEETQLEGFHRCYVRDPFGNRLELIEPLP